MSFDSESSGYNDSTKYSPLLENQHEDSVVVASEEEDRPIDIEEMHCTTMVKANAYAKRRGGNCLNS